MEQAETETRGLPNAWHRVALRHPDGDFLARETGCTVHRCPCPFGAVTWESEEQLAAWKQLRPGYVRRAIDEGGWWPVVLVATVRPLTISAGEGEGAGTRPMVVEAAGFQ